MRDREFEFEVYRLNVVDELDLFSSAMQSLREDRDIINVVEFATKSGFDTTSDGEKRTFLWSLRDFARYSDSEFGDVVQVSLARSIIVQLGSVVTEDNIAQGESRPFPPLAETVELLFFLRRHLVVVERNPSVVHSATWRRATEEILSTAAKSTGFDSRIVLEPRPKKNEVVQAFRSFEVLTRLRVHLRLPNPELSKYTQALYDDLRQGGIREYLQDMRNPGGLNQGEDARPFASAVMAQQGYKSKEVILEGYRNGRFERLVTGRAAARGTINQLRDFVRGLRANARAQETRAALAAVAEEIERIAPRDEEVA